MRFGWMLFLALRMHILSHFTDLVTCTNGLLAVIVSRQALYFAFGHTFSLIFCLSVDNLSSLSSKVDLVFSHQTCMSQY